MAPVRRGFPVPDGTKVRRSAVVVSDSYGATLHRLGHPSKPGNREIWDGVPDPNPSGEGVSKRRRLRHVWEIAHQTRQSNGTGLTISRLARPMCDTDRK